MRCFKRWLVAVAILLQSSSQSDGFSSEWAGNDRPRISRQSPSTERPKDAYSPFPPATERTRQAGKPRIQQERGLRRPPLVDSDLLRFLGQQKKLSRKLNETAALAQQQQKRPYAPSDPFTQFATMLADAAAVGMDAPSVLDDMTETVTPTTASECDAVVTTTQSPVDDDAWLGQYNCIRVVSVLSSRDKDLDASVALKAGERVQAQALARIARRRVRSFLKQRDREWGVTAFADVENGAAQQRQKDSTSTESSYGIDDVVDLLLSYGLTVRDTAEIMTHTPGVALMRPQPTADSNGESLQETLDRAFVRLLSETLRLRRYDARKVLRNSPRLLTMRGSRSAEQMVSMLSRLGVSTNAIARDKTALPTLLSRPPSAVFRLVAFLSSDAIRMPVTNIGPLLRRSQTLLDVVAPVSLALATEEMDEDTEIEVYGETLDGSASDPDVMDALWGRSGQVRRERINETYRSMSLTAWTLRNEIGTADLGKVIAAYPNVLLQNVDRQILPAASFLMNELGIWEDDLPRVLQLYPALLGMDVDKMREVATFLAEQEIDPETLSGIFRSFPALLTLAVDPEMIRIVDWLGSIGVVNIGRFISRLPPVLGYSIERELDPKWEFLQTVYTDPRFEVSKFPAYFSYPLERVIKTRFEYLQKVKGVPTQFVALDQVVRFGDKDFATKVAGDSDGKEFAKFAEKRRSALAPASKRRRKKKKEGSKS